MADASRFPGLALPFAIAGAAAGWLSQGLIGHPLVAPAPVVPRLTAGLVAGVLAGAVGGLLTRLCAGRRYGYEVDAPDPAVRLPTDRFSFHAGAILTAGAATGALLSAFDHFRDPLRSALLGFLGTLPFLLVAAAVIAAARRAQRARLGSLVAASDRRAVWGILATLLCAATLEALPDWQAPPTALLAGPLPAVALLGSCTACILLLLALDLRARRHAAEAVRAGLLAPDGAAPPEDEATRRLDLGLGAAVHHQIARTGPVYRARGRTIAVVQGDPREALAVLRRAIRRGALGLTVALLAGAAHAAATTSPAAALYEQRRCAAGWGHSCGLVADYLDETPLRARIGAYMLVALYQRGCDDGDAASCLSLARLYRGGEGVDPDLLMVSHFEYRAAQHGLCPPDTQLLHGAEKVCVQAGDPRLPR